MSRIVSRHDGSGTSYSQAAPSHHGKRSKTSSGQQIHNLCCNRCRKDLSTTVFVCKCDCVFCEDCTYSHFSNSSSCPTCGMTLGADDFLELCVADPSLQETTEKMAFQEMLTKGSSGSTHLTYQDMCKHALKSMDKSRRTVKFLLKQMVVHHSTYAQSAGSLNRAYEILQAEHTQLKQSMTSERLEAQQKMQELHNRNAGLTSKMQEMELKLKEQQRQIAQFRDHFRQPPGSSHSHGSSSNSNHYPADSYIANVPPPPMQAFVKNKAMATAANRSIGNKRPILGPAPINQHTDAFASTPIQIPNAVSRPSSEGSSSGPRVRDIRSNSGYVFAANRRQPGGTGHSPALVFAKPNQRNQPFHGY